jgi:hypothetical protein
MALSVNLATRMDFELRWQSAAATPLFDCELAFKAAWRFASRRSPNELCSDSAALRSFEANS